MGASVILGGRGVCVVSICVFPLADSVDLFVHPLSSYWNLAINIAAILA
jgi:hypothetical protein